MKKRIISLIAAATIVVSSAIPSYAMTTEEIIAGWEGVVNFSVDPYDSNCLKLEGSDGSFSSSQKKIEDVLNSLGVINSGAGGGYYVREDGSSNFAGLKKEKAESALAKYSFCAEWLKNNMPIVCPNGTDINEIISRCVNWVAGNLTYDHAAANSGDVMKYQSAYTAFNGSGIGVCSTYASAFTSMVAYVPIEIGSNKVNWDSENVYYLECGNFISDSHEWSGVKDPATGKWKQYDITNYDYKNRSIKSYLDMSAKTLASRSYYSNPTLYPVKSLRK